MLVMNVRNVAQALHLGAWRLLDMGKIRASRNGEVRVMPMPVTTVYQEPTERVLFDPVRDANPFFHLIESLWMLAGQRDVKTLAPYVKRMQEYSDDGKTLHGAYGHRWRRSFAFDQLRLVAQMLTIDPDTRRCVIQMWDAPLDLGAKSRDIPCNTHIYVWRELDGALSMTVCCRSNDMIWGAYGANAVHFSVLQEYLAAWIGCPLGHLYQISNNFHAYTATWPLLEGVLSRVPYPNHYTRGEVEPFPLISTSTESWDQDLRMFMHHGPVIGLEDPFFTRVVQPIFHAHAAYRQRDDSDRFAKAKEIMAQCTASDWRRACTEWLERREQRQT